MSSSNQERVCRVYAIKTVGGQECNVAFMLKGRAENRGLESLRLSAIIVLPNLKGFVFVENTTPYELQELCTGIKHYRGLVRGVMTSDEVLKSISRPIEINVGDIVEIIVEPFKGYRGKVIDVDRDRGQVHIELLDSSSTMPIIVSIKSVRKVESRG